MRLGKYLLVIWIFLFITGCGDDEEDDFIFVERDRDEQQIVDNDSLLGYLQTHYYNSEFLSTLDDPGINDIIISLAEEDSEGNLIVPEGHTILFESEDLEIVEDDLTFVNTEYTYYILRLNQGEGNPSPGFADTVSIVYSGFTQDNVVFDFVVTPEEIPMLTSSGDGVIEGWKRIIPTFRPALNSVQNGDGTNSYTDYGLGVMFLPSGLGYYGVPEDDIPAYSNLIFKFELYRTIVRDHDLDLISSTNEDLNNNLIATDDDTDGDGFPNYIDAEDDGDGVLTRNELKPNEEPYVVLPGEDEPILAENEIEVNRTEEEDGTIIIETVFIMDTNSNSIPDYLEEEIAIDYSSTE